MSGSVHSSKLGHDLVFRKIGPLFVLFCILVCFGFGYNYSLVRILCCVCYRCPLLIL